MDAGMQDRGHGGDKASCHLDNGDFQEGNHRYSNREMAKTLIASWFFIGATLLQLCRKTHFNRFKGFEHIGAEINILAVKCVNHRARATQSIAIVH